MPGAGAARLRTQMRQGRNNIGGGRWGGQHSAGCQPRTPRNFKEIAVSKAKSSTLSLSRDSSDPKDIAAGSQMSMLLRTRRRWQPASR